MEAADRIRQAVASVDTLRQTLQAEAALAAAVGDIKRLQSRRFAGEYRDLLGSEAYGAPTRFFLTELYSDKDYAQRDAQFARIAGAIERLFPEQVSQTAVALAQLHALTEELDQAMALAWLDRPGTDEAMRYVQAWRTVGRRADREHQLATVLDLGAELSRLTRARGLRTMLRMMRGPASAAGLSALQQFLENGFDTFAGMARRPQGSETFLATIRQRESALIAAMCDGDPVASGTRLAATLGQAP